VEGDIMARKTPVKKTGKKTSTAGKAGHKKQVKKTAARKAPAASRARARKKTPKARKAVAASAAAVPITSPEFGRDDPAIAD
jgi:hypothetical protein